MDSNTNYFKSNALYLFISAILVLLIFLPELGSFTFYSDYYYSIHTDTFFPSAYSNDFRVIAEFIRYFIFNGVECPSLYLLIGITSLFTGSYYILQYLKVTDRVYIVCAPIVFICHPYILSHYSFVNTRIIAPLGMLFSIGAIIYIKNNSKIRFTMSTLFILISLLLYQTSINVAIFLSIFFIPYDRKKGAKVIQLLVYRLFSIVGGIAAYFAVTTLYKLMIPSAGSRFSFFVKGIFNLAALADAFIYAKIIIYEYIFKSQFLFPFSEKIIYIFTLFLSSAAIFAFFKKQHYRYFESISYSTIPFISFLVCFGISIPFLSKNFLCYRLLSSFCLWNLGILLLLSSFGSRMISNVGKYIILFITIMSIIQVSIWHQFLFLSNKYDMFITENIANRILSMGQYKAKMPLVLKGTLNREVTKPFSKQFTFYDQKIVFSPESSVYENEWSKNRLLNYFSNTVEADAKTILKVEETTKGRQFWPSSESIYIFNGIAVVLLGPAPPR